MSSGAAFWLGSRSALAPPFGLSDEATALYDLTNRITDDRSHNALIWIRTRIQLRSDPIQQYHCLSPTLPPIDFYITYILRVISPPNWRPGSIALQGTTVHCMFLFINFLETPSHVHKDDSPVGPLVYFWRLQRCDWRVYPSDDDSQGDQWSGYCLYANH